MREKDSYGQNLEPARGEHIKGRGRTLTVGLRGENATHILSEYHHYPPARHTNGSAEARKAQQF